MSKYIITIEVENKTLSDSDTRKLISKTLNKLGEVISIAREVPNNYGLNCDFCGLDEPCDCCEVCSNEFFNCECDN